jgi:Lar family restriction alleviation protein
MNHAPSDSDVEQLELIYNALSQAQDCITDEPPEGMTYQEARRDTVDKVREAMRTVEAMQSPGPAQQPDSGSSGLLPCPFCGGKANVYENEVDFVTKWSVGCGDCNCNMDVCEDTPADAAVVWNTRIPGPAQKPTD